MIQELLNKRIFTLYIFPFIFGILSVFSFQPFNFTFINFLILPVIFYLIIFIKKKSKSKFRKKPYKKNFFIFGTVFGFGFYLGGLHWITNSLTFDDNFKILIPFGLFFIPLFLSLFFSILIVLIGPILKANFSSILLFSACLAFSDYLRAKIFTGFPWNLWAYSYSWNLEILQILNKLGLFTFNLVVITIFLLPSVLFLSIHTGKKLFILSLIPLFISSLYIYGDISLNKNQIFLNSFKNNKQLNINEANIKIVSPNFKLEYGLSNEEIKLRLKKLIKYSEPEENKTTIFIWPEGVFSGYSYQEIIFLKKNFSQSFSNKHYIVFGINRFNNQSKGLNNSLIIVNNNLEIIQEYKKQKLVPFGEFLPFERALKKIGLKKITEGYGSFLKGNKQENLEIQNLNILPLICYEIIFTEFIQQSKKDTNLIINISEDGWFGNSIGPHQHFSKAVFRAIEQNSFLIRSANKGISAFIDNKGKILKKLNANESGNIELQVPLIKAQNKNKNDLIFFILLITYISIFTFNNIKNDK